MKGTSERRIPTCDILGVSLAAYSNTTNRLTEGLGKRSSLTFFQNMANNT